MDGTHRAVKTPSSRCPVNQRNADNANEIETASNIKKSDFWNIGFSYWVIEMGDKKTLYSIDPSAANRQPTIAKRAIECTVDSPAIKFSGNWINPPSTAIAMIAVPISRAMPRTKSKRLTRWIRVRFISFTIKIQREESVWTPAASTSRTGEPFCKVPMASYRSDHCCGMRCTKLLS